MRTLLKTKNTDKDPRICYRGSIGSRFDTVTDSVFGIAITLLIFNLTNPNSFSDLILFTKTLPAFLISIGFIFLIWFEQLRFSEVYGFNDFILKLLNIVFIALVIFYVYPLRFLTLFLTNFFFDHDIQVNIAGSDVPKLMMYYGFIAFALYFVLFLLYARTLSLKNKLELSLFEHFYTKAQCFRLIIMFSVPLLSVLVTYLMNSYSFIWASILGGATYSLYTPAMIIWQKNYEKRHLNFPYESSI